MARDLQFLNLILENSLKYGMLEQADRIRAEITTLQASLVSDFGYGKISFTPLPPKKKIVKKTAKKKSQEAKGMKLLDLTLGNPMYMKDYWDNVDYSFINDANDSIPYGPAGGLEELKEKIILLHEKIGNAETKDRYIVIGHGVTQLLNAVLSKSPFVHAFSHKPYFFRFPQIFAAQGLIEIDKPWASGDFTELITVPSNPANETYPETNSKFKIYDLCYNWPQYGKVIKQDKDIMLFGLGKSTGHAGTKIGWAIVKDKNLYEDICSDIEITTGGVSADSQQKALHTINFILSKPDQSPYDHGDTALTARWTRLKAVNLPRLRILNSSGMFMWCELDGSANAAKEFEQLYGVKGLEGHHCGGMGVHVRFNIGCSQEDFEELIKRLK